MENVFSNYLNLLPLFLFSLIFTIIITPFVARLARRVKALDMPAIMRGRDERSISTRINQKVTPKLGGLAMIITFLAAFPILASYGLVNFDSGLWVGTALGLAILTIFGIVDDIYELNAIPQFIGESLAVIAVIASGVRIESIDFLQIELTLAASYIVTYVWIMAVMNFVNWMSGMDGIQGSNTSIALIAIILVATRTSSETVALLASLHLGAVVGILFYNYYPSKIFYGFGEYINGFLLAIFAIQIQGQFATTILIIGLPLVDAVWVSIQRIRKKIKTTKNPIKLLAATLSGDKNHLHHKLMELGYSWKTVMFIELSIMTVFAGVALYFSQFSDPAILLVILLATLFMVIAAISAYANSRRNRKPKEEKPPTPEPDEFIDEEDLEEKYAY